MFVKVGFKDGQQHKDYRCLHHPVPDRWDSQRPFLSIRFRDIHAAHRFRAVGFPSQIGFEFREPPLALSLILCEIFDPHAIDSGCSPVGDHLPERGLEYILSAHVPIQAPCFPVRLAFGLPVERPLQFPNSRGRFRHRGR